MSIAKAIEGFPPIRWLLTQTKFGRLLGTARNLTKWFGVPVGLKVLLRTLRSDETPIPVTPRGLHHPVWIRPGTTDPLVYRELFYEQSYGWGLPPRADFIIDAGANIGLTSVFLANHFPGATIVAIEPSSRNFEVLQKNIQPFPNVTAKLAGLWPTSGPLQLVERKGEDWAHQVRPCQPEEASFQGVTPTQLLADSGKPRIDVLKVDIEGSEWPLFFDQPPDWLKFVDLLSIELHPLGNTLLVERIVAVIEQYGLRAVRSGIYNHTFKRAHS